MCIYTHIYAKYNKLNETHIYQSYIIINYFIILSVKNPTSLIYLFNFIRTIYCFIKMSKDLLIVRQKNNYIYLAKNMYIARILLLFK